MKKGAIAFAIIAGVLLFTPLFAGQGRVEWGGKTWWGCDCAEVACECPCYVDIVFSYVCPQAPPDVLEYLRDWECYDSEDEDCIYFTASITGDGGYEPDPNGTTLMALSKDYLEAILDNCEE
ncbi:hypothetical protein GF359_10220 [candidate division WOR-3 bacterium]|uniref:Uncharacterized protein n=1 Tax=candidate division WOR-3 bacterium TaxID=2052148 RepID=A0A9D5KCI6_UNCW3|nr:hypothetical protein [candidate division WOR-3 bacterium]MBD3365575.1 hypothetical protein [candidate division WOR-3 bacterium]